MKKLINSILGIRKVLFQNNDSQTEHGMRLERKRKILLTSLTGAFSKILAMTLPLLTIKITYGYLGASTYGLWMALTSFFSLFQFADLGLGNGLKTKLSFSIGKNQYERSLSLISTTFYILITAAIVSALLFSLSYPIINWEKIIPNSNNGLINTLILSIILSRIISIPLSIVERTQNAFQEGYKTNIWISFSYIVTLLSMYSIMYFDLGKNVMIWTATMITVVISLLNLIWYFRFEKRDYAPKFSRISLSISKEILSTGILFLILSILTTIGLALDNFIIAKIAPLEEVATYSILFKVTFMISSVTTMLSAPLWSANGDALAKRDYLWIENNTKKMSKILLLISSFGSTLLVISSKFVFDLWLGNEFVFSYNLLIPMCILQILLSFITSYFMMFNALGLIKIQIVIFLIYTPVSVFLKYYLGGLWGVEAVAWTGVICYVFLIIIPVVYIFNEKIQKLKGGI